MGKHLKVGKKSDDSYHLYADLPPRLLLKGNSKTVILKVKRATKKKKWLDINSCILSPGDNHVTSCVFLLLWQLETYPRGAAVVRVLQKLKVYLSELCPHSLPPKPFCFSITRCHLSSSPPFFFFISCIFLK